MYIYYRGTCLPTYMQISSVYIHSQPEEWLLWFHFHYITVIDTKLTQPSTHISVLGAEFIKISKHRLLWKHSKRNSIILDSLAAINKIIYFISTWIFLFNVDRQANETTVYEWSEGILIFLTLQYIFWILGSPHRCCEYRTAVCVQTSFTYYANRLDMCAICVCLFLYWICYWMCMCALRIIHKTGVNPSNQITSEYCCLCSMKIKYYNAVPSSNSIFTDFHWHIRF